MIILEDMHWADQDTLEALKAIARLLGKMRLLMLCTHRSEEARERKPVWEALLALDKTSSCHRLSLHRLTESETVEGALALHKENLTLARKVAFRSSEAEALTDLGLDYLLLGRRDEALSRLEAGLVLARGLGPRSMVEALLGLSQAWLACGHPRKARLAVTEALSLAKAMDGREWLIQGHYLLGRTPAMLGEPGMAEEALRQALEMADPPAYPMWRWRVMAAMAHLLERRGQRREARAIRNQAWRIVEGVAEGLGDEGLCSSFLALTEMTISSGESKGPCPSPYEGRTRLTLVRLVATGAPLGRPLRDDERVTVVWMVDDGPGDAAVRSTESRYD